MNAWAEHGAGIHEACALCTVSVDVALDFLKDGLALGRWALGCWSTEAVGEGIFRGRSLFDDGPCYVMPVADRALGRVDYHVGADRESLVPRIHALAVPTPATSAGHDTCMVTLSARRDDAMDDARWLRLVRCHDTEILLIQALLARRSHHPA